MLIWVLGLLIAFAGGALVGTSHGHSGGTPVQVTNPK